MTIGMAPPYRILKIRNGDGQEVKMKVKRELLNPYGRDIVAKFNFSGVNIYVHQGEEIKVGSSPTCDIIINDSSLNPEHAKIVHTPTGVVVILYKPSANEDNSKPKEEIK